jgi:low affinity Fe/Cu permease
MTENNSMPSSVEPGLGIFDRFASRTSAVVSRAPFFAFCVLLILLWLPSYFFFHDVSTWQLIINTATTCITFLLVALLQNSAYRSDRAVQHKLNAIADALAEFMEKNPTLDQDVAELRSAVGIEEHESSSG